MEPGGAGKCYVRCMPVSSRGTHHCSGILVGYILWAKEFQGTLQGHGQGCNRLARPVDTDHFESYSCNDPETQTMVVCELSTTAGRALEVSSSSSLRRRLLAANLGLLRKMLSMEQICFPLFGNLSDSRNSVHGLNHTGGGMVGDHRAQQRSPAKLTSPKTN